MIVSTPHPVATDTGIVVGRATGGYLVQTSGGKTVRAASTTTWRIGAHVTVLAGQIIGPSGHLQASKVYMV